MESVEVEAKSKVVRVDEEAATLKANEAQALKNECESDLAEAIPALEAALSALDTLKVNTLQPHCFIVPDFYAVGPAQSIQWSKLSCLFHFSPLMSQL